MADSPEYKTFCDLSDVIQTATRMSVSPVATKAFAKGLITAEQLNTMTFMFLPPDMQAQQLVQAVRDRIFIKPEALTFFRDILASDPVYETIVGRIDTHLSLQKRTADLKQPVGERGSTTDRPMETEAA